MVNLGARRGCVAEGGGGGVCFRSRRGSFNAEAGFPAGRGLAGSAGWRTMSCSW